MRIFQLFLHCEEAMTRKVKYIEIYHRIKDQILAGEYRVGDRLPTEKEFADQFDVSVHTVRQAMALFKTEGVIRKVAGNGTFVDAMPGAGGSQVVSAKNIGIVVWNRTRHIFPRILPAIEETVFPHGYHNVVCNTGNDPQREREVIERLIEQGIRGFIISPISWDGYSLESYRYIQKRNIPLVMINRRAKGLRATSVSVNNEEAGYVAARRLLEAGHRTIGHLSSSAIRTELTDGRIRGYRRALKDFDVPFDERLIAYDDGEEGGLPGLNGATKVLSRNPDVTGIFCVNDHHVPGLVRAAEQLGRRVPDDLSVVSFDQSMEIQANLPFQLDTQRYPAVNVGICAAKELLAQIGGDDSMVKTIELDPISVYGHSCLPCVTE
jgi:GntR family transcriptional regulator of arabinose operon